MTLSPRRSFCWLFKKLNAKNHVGWLVTTCPHCSSLVVTRQSSCPTHCTKKQAAQPILPQKNLPNPLYWYHKSSNPSNLTKTHCDKKVIFVIEMRNGAVNWDALLKFIKSNRLTHFTKNHEKSSHPTQSLTSCICEVHFFFLSQYLPVVSHYRVWCTK